MFFTTITATRRNQPSISFDRQFRNILASLTACISFIYTGSQEHTSLIMKLASRLLAILCFTTLLAATSISFLVARCSEDTVCSKTSRELGTIVFVLLAASLASGIGWIILDRRTLMCRTTSLLPISEEYEESLKPLIVEVSD